MKPKRKLQNMMIKEVSLVGAPANKQSFLFWKSDGNTTVEITTDGTKKGTSIKLNGEELDDISSFYMSMYECDDNVCCNFTRKVEAEDGFKRVESYTLSKGGIVMDKIQTILKSLFGDDFKIEKHENAEAVCKALEESLTVVQGYSNEMPDDLAKAIKGLANVAVQVIEEKKEVKTEPAANANAQVTQPANATTETQKGDDEVKKQLKDIADAITKMKEDNSQNADTFKKVTDRIENLEKKADSQVLKGQDANKINKGDTDDPFPSWKF